MKNNMKQWTELYFILNKDDGSILELGTDKYPIVKDNALFQSLTTFENSNEEREIPIEVYINGLDDIKEFSSFFELSSNNVRYKLETHCNGLKYNSTITTDGKPYEVGNVEDLYGTLTQPTSTIKLDLIMQDPFFYSDYSYDVEIGAGINSLVKFPSPIRLNNTQLFAVSIMAPVMPHIVDNVGNENNGIIVNIYSGRNLVQPRIINDTTGFEMGFNLSSTLEDVIVINTIEKTVYKNGIYQPNVKRLFDKWLTLERGKNLLRFEAGDDAELCRVQIQFYNKYRAIG